MTDTPTPEEAASNRVDALIEEWGVAPSGREFLQGKFERVLREQREAGRREGGEKMQDACELAVRDVFPDHYAVPIRALDVDAVLADDQEDESDA